MLCKGGGNAQKRGGGGIAANWPCWGAKNPIARRLGGYRWDSLAVSRNTEPLSASLTLLLSLRIMLVPSSWLLRWLHYDGLLRSAKIRSLRPENDTKTTSMAGVTPALPCPSIPCFFCFTKEKPQIYQGFSLTGEPTKSLEKTEKIPK